MMTPNHKPPTGEKGGDSIIPAVLLPDFDVTKLPGGVDVSRIVGSELVINDALPGLVRGEATALLLDVNNLYRRARENGFSIDYVQLQSIFSHRCDLRYCSAFSAVDKDNQNSMNWASYMTDKGYSVITKDLKRYTNDKGQLVTKGNMDIEITIAALSLSEAFSHIVIGTCDGDFVPLLEKLREGHFRKVSVLGMRNKNWTGMSESLVRSADHFYDMMQIKDFISYHGNRGE